GSRGSIGMRINTPELLLNFCILYTTRMVQLLNFSFVQYNRPMPPWLPVNPSLTYRLPGPTCFQPLRSLPSKSCRHPFAESFLMSPWAFALCSPSKKIKHALTHNVLIIKFLIILV